MTPDDATAWTCLGNALKDVGRNEAAIVAQRQATACAPENATVLLNLAVALRQTQAWHEALAALGKAAALAPHDPDIAWERALLHLQLGQYRAGFAAYESRFALPSGPQLPAGLRRWTGEEIAGRRIVLLAEQGFGDSFLAVRYIAQLQTMGAHVTLQCRAAARRLFAAIPGIDTLTVDEPLPAHDLVCPLMSLPGCCGTLLYTIPPPWRPAPDAAARSKLAGIASGGLRVGICWAGSDGFAGNRQRSVPLDDMLTLLEYPTIRLFSLQKGPHANEAQHAEAAGLLAPLAANLDDFAETAAAIAVLDLVVTTDSAVAHLAASVGTPTWVLLHQSPYWIFGTGGATTPWYPAMRLFRQQRAGDWAGVMVEVLACLRSHAFPTEHAQ